MGFVWAQTEAQFAIRGITSSLTKFHYCVGALGPSGAAQIVNLIEFTTEEQPYKSLKEHLTELHTLNPFQRHKAHMSLTLVAEEKPSALIGNMCSLLPLKHQCIRKLTVKADEIWQSASFRSVNEVSTAFPSPPVEKASVNVSLPALLLVLLLVLFHILSGLLLRPPTRA